MHELRKNIYGDMSSTMKLFGMEGTGKKKDFRSSKKSKTTRLGLSLTTSMIIFTQNPIPDPSSFVC
ncbi:hypothetical protein D8674_031690 [Pyrus ussuriensis x Pyrus communis]|uniref:Uncharacterized protein n=1 Tax=Pyrus ussuriensis x Pyrus communis TaxID=2448454 RepID=A0A5N5F4X7_9ROSA|nr:hypothetical protein D8674_031690 [Pyrus ussuriensis x Pyrus communis]